MTISRLIRWGGGMVLALLLAAPAAQSDIIKTFPTTEKIIALTFDGCEGRGKPAALDHSILAVLEQHQVPATIFVTGLFAQRHRNALQALAADPRIELENHSWDHPQHMEALPASQQHEQIQRTNQIIAEITGRPPKYFRFPAGNSNDDAVRLVEGLGLQVVHWRWPSGDPAQNLTPQHLTEWIEQQARSGDILIFHINGRAPATASALSVAIPYWQRKGFRFVRLDQVLP